MNLQLLANEQLGQYLHNPIIPPIIVGTIGVDTLLTFSFSLGLFTTIVVVAVVGGGLGLVNVANLARKSVSRSTLEIGVGVWACVGVVSVASTCFSSSSSSSSDELTFNCIEIRLGAT